MRAGLDTGYHIETDQELLDFVEWAWGIYIPRVQVCENHVSPAYAFCEAYFARAPISVWWASRGLGGKSMLLSLLSITEAVTLGATVNILGGSGKQSQGVLDYMSQFWGTDNAPKQLLASEPAATKARLTNGAQITALAASQTSVRGPHQPRLRLDEIDEMDLALLDASMGQTMIMRGVPTQTVMSSTRQYMGGTMDTILKRAGDKGWPVHSWCYRENLEPNGWLTQAFVAQKKSEITTAMWNAEYELQEPAPDSRAINPDAVNRMFQRRLGEFAGALHEFIQIEEWQDGGRYTTGTDWARKHDYTEIVTIRLDVHPYRIVAYERTGRLEWPVMVEKFNKRLAMYPGGQAFHDTTGIGDVVAGYIDSAAIGLMMVGRQRSDMLTNLIAAIERGEFEAPFIKSLYTEFAYASVDDVYGGSASGHLPDGIAASALAMWAELQKGSHIKQGESPDEIADFRG